MESNVKHCVIHLTLLFLLILEFLIRKLFPGLTETANPVYSAVSFLLLAAILLHGFISKEKCVLIKSDATTLPRRVLYYANWVGIVALLFVAFVL